MINGFSSSDIVVTSYKNGLSITRIIETTLPHSFELLGFWISGGIGFNITRAIIQFMRGKEYLYSVFYKKIGLYSILVFVIIITAAYVEAYITYTK
jgi:Integral membrane protein DUF95.